MRFKNKHRKGQVPRGPFFESPGKLFYERKVLLKEFNFCCFLKLSSKLYKMMKQVELVCRLKVTPPFYFDFKI